MLLKKFAGLAATFAMASLVACGENLSSEETEIPTTVNLLEEAMSFTCSGANMCTQIFVIEMDQPIYCNGQVWTFSLSAACGVSGTSAGSSDTYNPFAPVASSSSAFYTPASSAIGYIPELSSSEIVPVFSSSEIPYISSSMEIIPESSSLEVIQISSSSEDFYVASSSEIFIVPSSSQIENPVVSSSNLLEMPSSSSYSKPIPEIPEKDFADTVNTLAELVVYRCTPNKKCDFMFVREMNGYMECNGDNVWTLVNDRLPSTCEN